METVNKKDVSNRYLVPEDSDRLPEKRAPKTDAARLYPFSAIMGQQALCQVSPVAAQNEIFIILLTAYNHTKD